MTSRNIIDILFEGMRRSPKVTDVGGPLSVEKTDYMFSIPDNEYGTVVSINRSVIGGITNHTFTLKLDTGRLAKVRPDELRYADKPAK